MSEIEDRFAITDVLSMYAHLADTDQYHRIAEEIFSEDAVLDWGLGEVAGRAALQRWFGAPRPGLLGTSHTITNVMVRIDGDHARALHKMVGWHWFADPADDGIGQQANIVMVGGYDDVLRREREGWRVTRRTAYQLGPGGIGIGPHLPPMIVRLIEATKGRKPDW